MTRLPITVIDNAHILTQDPRQPESSAVAVADGKILAVGEDALSLPIDHRWDARGRTLLPGFNDVHAHSVWYGQTLVEVDLSGVSETAEIYRRLSRAKPQSGWVVASGFVNARLNQPLVLEELDKAVTLPLVIKHNSGHAYTVNSAALKLAGIDPAHPPAIPGGEFVVDSRGHCTGLLDENAMRPIQKILLPESQADISRALERATEKYAQMGLTSVTDAGVAGGWIGHSPREIAAYQNSNLKTRMQVMVTSDVLHRIDGHEEDGPGWGIDGGIRTGLGNEWLQLGPVKIFTDGSLLGTTAAMTTPYHCHDHCGYFQDDPETLKQRALEAAGSGWSLALHAIGDAAVDLAIDIISEAVRRYGTPVMPHRIEHGGVVRPDQISRLSPLPAVVVPQPYFINAFGDEMAASLGPDRVAFSYPAKSLLEAGLPLPGSSDRPVAPGTPLRSIQAFVERRTASGEIYGPAERISVSEAIYAYTAGSAAATGWAGRKGQVKAGQLADFVLLDENPLEVPTHELASIGVAATFLGGELSFGKI